MGTDAGNIRWSEGKGSSAVTANIIQHHLGYWRVVRRRRAIPKFADNRPNPTRMASNPWKIDQMLRQTEIDSEKGTAHAFLALRRNPSGGYQLDALETEYNKQDSWLSKKVDM
jgi:hypothetical protein